MKNFSSLNWLASSGGKRRLASNNAHKVSINDIKLYLHLELTLPRNEMVSVHRPELPIIFILAGELTPLP